jgi:hypothetical protein
MTKPTRPLPEHSDFHRQGIFAVASREGDIDFETFGSTAHASRANYLRKASHTWSAALEKGFEIHEYEPVARVVKEPSASAEAADEILPGVPKTAEDWSLYVDQPGAEDAALTLAGDLSRLLRAEAINVLAVRDVKQIRQARAYVLREMQSVMSSLSSLGADDTEPRGILDDILDRAFRTQ